jgi:RNA-directed DNA polymerase
VILAKLDQALFQALGRWGKRRHPHKPPGGMRQQYFPRGADNRWGCFGTTTRHGKTRAQRWMRWADTPLTGPRTVKAEANPSAPEWERSFAARWGVKRADALKGRRRLRYLWRAHEGIGPVCQQSSTKRTGGHNHHLVWRSQGGADGAAHRVLRHPHGHRHVQSQGLDVAKPRPQKGR